MKTFDFKNQWGDVTRVRLVRGAYADGCWEPFATLTTNLGDARSQNASFAYVDANNLPIAADFLVENGLVACAQLIWHIRRIER